jgi:hypothetical protein
MAQFPDSLQSKTGFFHSLGLVPTESTQNWYESSYKSSHNIRGSEIWLDDIPYALNQTILDNSILPNNSTIIKKYTMVSLSQVFGSNGQTWYFNTGGTFIRNWISPVDVPHQTTNAPSYGFQMKLYDNSGVTIGLTSSNWVVDYYAGMIKFAPGYIPTSAPKATFYQYIGRTGNNLSNANFVIVNTLTERNNINNRYQGMIVHVISESLNYQLIGGILNSNWQVLGSKITPTNVFYIDSNRIDNYIEDGSIINPFKSIYSGISYINSLNKDILLYIQNNEYLEDININLDKNINIVGLNKFILGNSAFTNNINLNVLNNKILTINTINSLLNNSNNNLIYGDIIISGNTTFSLELNNISLNNINDLNINNEYNLYLNNSIINNINSNYLVLKKSKNSLFKNSIKLYKYNNIYNTTFNSGLTFDDYDINDITGFFDCDIYNYISATTIKNNLLINSYTKYKLDTNNINYYNIIFKNLYHTEKLTINNKNMYAIDTTNNTGITLACSIPILGYPINNSQIHVFINGVEVKVGNNINDDCYFSPDGIIIRESGTEKYGDYLYWSYNNTNYFLENTDSIDFVYIESNVF